MPVPGDLILLISPKGKRYLHHAGEGADVHTHDGVIEGDAILKTPYGGTVTSHLGKPYRIIRPTIYDLVKGVKRQTQIIYPKEIGYLVMRLGIGPGCKVIEAGSGSGSLTLALSHFCGETGEVHTHEAREEFFKLCRRNLDWAGLGQNVTQYNVDIAEGFQTTDADALFLDVRTPWDYLHHIPAAVKPGAPLGFLLPTVNQLSMLLEGLEQGPFSSFEVVEILIRRYKPVPERMRPEDRMVAHTGFLVFARHEEAALVQTPPRPPKLAPGDAAASASLAEHDAEDGETGAAPQELPPEDDPRPAEEGDCCE